MVVKIVYRMKKNMVMSVVVEIKEEKRKRKGGKAFWLLSMVMVKKWKEVDIDKE